MRPNSLPSTILRRIRARGRGSVFTPKDFLGVGTRSAIDIALWRLTRQGKIRRLAQGLYDYPRLHAKLGMLSPNPDEVAEALAAKTGSRVQISGQRAANLLGLSEQVPSQLVYLTDGPPQKVKIGLQLIRLTPARPSKFPEEKTRAGMAIQAITAMGPKANKEFIARRLRSVLNQDERRKLVSLMKFAPTWSHDIIEAIGR